MTLCSRATARPFTSTSSAITKARNRLRGRAANTALCAILSTPRVALVYTRFHEGIDIRPMHRDANGEPLDEVRAIADGKVVHTNLVPGYSNYGKYIVIEHRWDGSSYYSLYGHLSSIHVHSGDSVKRGQPIAIMGYTGVGINRERAHLHLELDLMFSHQFEAWHDAFFRNDPNHNGIYNGLNLAGLDIARLYLALHKNPSTYHS